MTQINLPFNIQPGQLEDISQVMANIEAIVSVVNGGLGNDNFAPGSLLTIDKIQGGPPGTTMVTGPTGVPTWQPAGGLPPGVIVPFAGDTPPAGFLLCDGVPKQRTDYLNLYAVVLDKYPGGDGVNTFGIPNLQGRVPVGKGASALFDTLGEMGGSEVAPLVEANLPAHTHKLNNHNHGGTVVNAGLHSHWALPTSTPGRVYGDTGILLGEMLQWSGQPGQADVYYSPQADTSADGIHNHTINPDNSNTDGGSGSATQHPNVQPYLVINYLIKT